MSTVTSDISTHVSSSKSDVLADVQLLDVHCNGSTTLHARTQCVPMSGHSYHLCSYPDVGQGVRSIGSQPSVVSPVSAMTPNVSRNAKWTFRRNADHMLLKNTQNSNTCDKLLPVQVLGFNGGSMQILILFRELSTAKKSDVLPAFRRHFLCR